MAGMSAECGAKILLVTANVGSLFEDNWTDPWRNILKSRRAEGQKSEGTETLQKVWLKEFLETVKAHKPHFLALHCQECGGKNSFANMSEVDNFISALISSPELKEYKRGSIYIDKTQEFPEYYTALGSFYFIHESVKSIFEFNFDDGKFQKLTRREIRVIKDGQLSLPTVQKEKFPADFFPQSVHRPTSSGRDPLCSRRSSLSQAETPSLTCGS